MAITFPITGVTNTFASTRSPSFTLGTAPATDDIIIVMVACTTVPAAVTDVSGWTNVLGANVNVESDAHASSMHYHRVTSAESGASTTSWTLTNLQNAIKTGQISVAVLRGVATSSELVGASSTFANSNTADPWVIASVTPTADNCQVMAGLSGDGTQTQTTPGGWTLQANGNATESCYVYSCDTLGSNGVPTGTTNVTPSTGDEYVSIVACFKETAAATNASAGSAAVTTTANNPSQAVAANIGTAAVTATANNPNQAVAANIGTAAVVATAYNATVSTAAATNAAAGVATVTVTANGAPASIEVKPGVAAVMVTAQNPSLTVAASPGRATVTVTAFNPGPSITVNPGVAAVAVTAQAPTLSLLVGAGAASVTFTGQGPTALTEGTVLGPYRSPMRWREPVTEDWREPRILSWHEPDPTVGSFE